jgi:1-acyl-sn-glycerol-3-phosphate acyltransferase
MYYSPILSLNTVSYFWRTNDRSMILFRWLHTIYATILFVITFLVWFPLLFVFAQKASWHIYAYKLTQFWGFIFFFLVGIRVKIENENEEKLPKPCIYVANHFSFSDIAAFTLVANDACFVGKQSIEKAPLFGYFFTSLHITVNRSSLRDRASVIAKSVEALENGKSLFIFPEGGIRSTNPPHQVKYKDGAFRTAISKGVSIVPVTFPYNWRLFPDDGKFLLRSNYLNIVVHKAIDTTNLTDSDIPVLRDMTQKIIQTELLSRN